MEESTKEGKGRHDLLMQEIEAIDDYWGPTFRYYIKAALLLRHLNNGEDFVINSLQGHFRHE